MPHPLRVHPGGRHLPEEETAGAGERVDGAVCAQAGVQRRLESADRALGERTVVAAPQDGLVKVAAETGLAEPPVVEEEIRRTGQLVVVKGHHRRDALQWSQH